MPLPGPAQTELWEQGGIGPARLAIMQRVSSPKAVLAAGPDAVAFVALADGVAVLHALHVRPPARRRGLATALLDRARQWAASQGAGWLALLVETANGPANSLYEGAGFQAVLRYHYRVAPP